MSEKENISSSFTSTEKLENIDLIVPSSGKLFFESKKELQFCKPYLMPLKSSTLEKLEKMQKDAHELLKQNRKEMNISGATEQEQEKHHQESH